MLKQTGYEFDYLIKTFDTKGDKDKTTPISQIEGSDFFTDTIEKALLKNEIDVAVHSAKDLPDVIHKDLYIAAITKSIDPYDVLVVGKDLNYKSLDELPYNAKIGTCSQRRKQQLKQYRADFEIIEIRGNIDERIKYLDESQLHAIVIAAAGLVRLGLEERITQRIPFEIITPHPLQGCLAIEVRKNDITLIEIFKNFNYGGNYERKNEYNIF